VPSFLPTLSGRKQRPACTPNRVFRIDPQTGEEIVVREGVFE
jgi:topoisomerase IA-like protein